MSARPRTSGLNCPGPSSYHPASSSVCSAKQAAGGRGTLYLDAFYGTALVHSWQKARFNGPWRDTTSVPWGALRTGQQTRSWDLYLRVTYTHKTGAVSSFFLESRTRYQQSPPQS